jgi:hypothetical protein
LWPVEVSDREAAVAARREEAFQQHFASMAPYFDAVRENGGVPWFEDPEHLAKLEPAFPGISEHPGIEARRMFFIGRYDRPAPPAGLMTDPRKRENYTEEINA